MKPKVNTATSFSMMKSKAKKVVSKIMQFLRMKTQKVVGLMQANKNRSRVKLNKKILKVKNLLCTHQCKTRILKAKDPLFTLLLKMMILKANIAPKLNNLNNKVIENHLESEASRKINLSLKLMN